jgi:hypothetical protein
MAIIKTILIAILITANLTSCMTMKLWQKGSYVENFKNFLITKDGKKIVILGEKYHYIFDDNSGDLYQLLTWENNSKLEIENYNFRISKINEIICSITIKNKSQKNSTTHLSKKDKSFLQKLGFVNNSSDEVIFKKNIIISGQRYYPKTGLNYGTSTPLNHDYSVNIEIDDYANKTKKIALTPVAVAGDGALVFAIVGLIVLDPHILRGVFSSSKTKEN